jgi:hypothetical protein
VAKAGARSHHYRRPGNGSDNLPSSPILSAKRTPNSTKVEVRIAERQAHLVSACLDAHLSKDHVLVATAEGYADQFHAHLGLSGFECSAAGLAAALL